MKRLFTLLGAAAIALTALPAAAQDKLVVSIWGGSWRGIVADAIARWGGLCPANNQSADKRKPARKLKGNTYVRRLLCEFALAAAKTCCAFQAKYKSLTIRRGHKRAIMACAHKMIRALHAMLRKGEPYRDSTVDLDALIGVAEWLEGILARPLPGGVYRAGAFTPISG